MKLADFYQFLSQDVLCSNLRNYELSKLDFCPAESANFHFKNAKLLHFCQIRNVFNFFFVQKIKRKAKLFFVVVIVSLSLGQMNRKTRKMFGEIISHYFMVESSVKRFGSKKNSRNFRLNTFAHTSTLKNWKFSWKTRPKLSLNTKCTFSPTERKKNFSCGIFWPVLLLISSTTQIYFFGGLKEAVYCLFSVFLRNFFV